MAITLLDVARAYRNVEVRLRLANDHTRFAKLAAAGDEVLGVTRVKNTDEWGPSGPKTLSIKGFKLLTDEEEAPWRTSVGDAQDAEMLSHDAELLSQEPAEEVVQVEDSPPPADPPLRDAALQAPNQPQVDQPTLVKLSSKC